MSDPRRRPTKPERIGELLGGAARALGLEEELRRGRQGAAFAAMLEARLRGAELSSAFAAWPEGEGSFRVVVRLAGPDRRLR